MKPVKKKGRPHKISMDVVGMQHRVTKTTRGMIADYVKLLPIMCKLEREPENPADKNAIKVIAANGSPYSGIHLGYIPRVTAEILAPALDKGQAEVLNVTLTSVDPDDGDGEIVLTFRQLGKFRLD